MGTQGLQCEGGSMVVKGALTHPCPGFAVGKPTMVVVRVQGAPGAAISQPKSHGRDHPDRKPVWAGPPVIFILGKLGGSLAPSTGSQ
jgi:hypothetical protein